MSRRYLSILPVPEPSVSTRVGLSSIDTLSEHTFEINRERAIDYLNTRENVYVFDGYAGWDPKYRIKVRVIASRAYHALFMVSWHRPGPTTRPLAFPPH